MSSVSPQSFLGLLLSSYGYWDLVYSSSQVKYKTGFYVTSDILFIVVLRAIGLIFEQALLTFTHMATYLM